MRLIAYAIVDKEGKPLEIKLINPSEVYLKMVAWSIVGGKDIPGNKVDVKECVIDIP